MSANDNDIFDLCSDSDNQSSHCNPNVSYHKINVGNYPWGSTSHKSNSSDVISILESDSSEDDVEDLEPRAVFRPTTTFHSQSVFQEEQSCSSSSQSPSLKSLDDMIDSSDDELAKLSMLERRQIARETWNKSRKVNEMYLKNDTKISYAITTVSPTGMDSIQSDSGSKTHKRRFQLEAHVQDNCTPAARKEQVGHKQTYVERTSRTDTMRNRKELLDSAAACSSEQPIPIQNPQRGTNTLKSPTNLPGMNSESISFDTVSKYPGSITSIGVHCLPRNYDRYECSNLSSLQSPLQKTKDHTCAHPLRIKAQRQQQVKQRKGYNEKSLVRPKNDAITLRSPAVHLRVVSEEDIQERKQNTFSVQCISGITTMQHMSGTVKEDFKQEHTFRNSMSDSSLGKKQKANLTGTPSNGKIAQCLLSKLPHESDSRMGITTSQQLEDRKSECMPPHYKLLDDVSRNERTIDLTLEDEPMETGGNVSDSIVLPESQNKCSIQQSNNTSPTGKIPARRQCKPSDSPWKCNLPSPPVDKTKVIVTSSHCQKVPKFIECDTSADTGSDDSQNNLSVATNLSSDDVLELKVLEKDDKANLKNRPRENCGIECRSMRVRANINYKEHANILLTSDSHIYYTAHTKSRRISKKKEKKVHEETKQNLFSKRRGRPRKNVPTEGSSNNSNLDSVPDQANNPSCGNDRDLMVSISHLSRKSFDQHTNLPRQKISVLNCFDETIYDFEIFVKKSGIPNSGHGAFMRYLGARVLKLECAQRSTRLLNARHQVPKKTLTASRPEGFGVSVKLTGTNLHGNNNSEYWVNEAFPMTAKHPVTKKTIKLSLIGKNLHYDSDEEEAPLVRQEQPSWRVQRIGFLGIHVESDYVSDDSLKFASTNPGCGYIDLGRYGPNTKGDRKTKAHYEIKSFLFDGEPAGWGFQVEEAYLGREQLIDITSDATGEICESAKKMTAIYVNEIGHNRELVQNVHAREKDGRVVQYYADITTPLSKGEKVELLTTYFSIYEDNRERRGYGIANFEEGVKDDSHEPSRLQRNFDDRYEVDQALSLHSVIDLFHVCEFICTSILPHLSSLADDFIQMSAKQSLSQPGTLPTHRQFVARRRIHWLSCLIENRIRVLLLTPQDSSLPKAGLESMLKQAERWCLDMKWDPIFPDHDSHCSQINNRLRAFKRELVEEFLFPIREKLPNALDETTWCPVAVELIKKLCAHTAFHTRNKVTLAMAYFDCAKWGVVAIREACRMPRNSKPPSKLAFDFGDNGYNQISGDELWKVVETLSGPESILSKGIMAKAADLRAYYDLVELGLVSAPIDRANLIVKIEGLVFVSKVPYAAENTSCCTIGLPRGVDCFRDGVAELDEDWYIVWQVLYTVHVFAAHYLSGCDVLSSFLEKLCDEVKIDFLKAKLAVESGIKLDVHLPKIKCSIPRQPEILRRESIHKD